MNETTDSDLLQAYADTGSESAFAELVSRHVGLVYSVARRIVVDTHLAEDVTQATFAALAREGRHLSRRVFLSGWLHRTASNLAAKLVRGEMRRRAREQELYGMESTTSESGSKWNEIAPLLDGAVNKLAEADRAVILLRFFEKKTSREIGAVLKLSEEAAQKRVVRALDRLRGLLADQGAVVSGATLGTLITTQAVSSMPLGLASSVTTTAIAGSTAAGAITLTTLKIIAMSKLKVSAVSALVVACLAAPFVLQHQSLIRLRVRNAALQEQARLVNVLTADNEKLSEQLVNARQTQTLTKAQLSELLRLRGEVGPLRRDSQELARLRAKQLAEQATAGHPAAAPDFVPATSWANMGSDKPEAALQTFFWAGKHGETNLVGNLLRWQRDTEIPASDELDAEFANGIISGSTRFAGELQGFRLISQNAEPNGEVRMGVELTGQDGNASTHTIRLVREDNQWFPVMHVWLQDPKSVRAALDVPPKFSSPNVSP